MKLNKIQHSKGPFNYYVSVFWDFTYLLLIITFPEHNDLFEVVKIVSILVKNYF